jgi:AcrR family transcriptional regulator
MRQQAVPGPKRRNREAEVLDAAIGVFWEKGYSGASIQAVADRVGVLKGSLYYYIRSKEDLLSRVVDEVHRESTEILDEVLALKLSAIDRIRIYIERHVEWYLDNIKEVSVFFREWRHLSGERLGIVLERRRGYDRAVRDLIAAAQVAGDVPADIDPKHASLYVLAAVNAVPDWFSPSGHDSARMIAESYAAMTVGLLQGTRRPNPAIARQAA